ncbi:helix-hairpin-helix domain-containing protein [Clostridiaceae bacterium 35-E11]
MWKFTKRELIIICIFISIIGIVIGTNYYQNYFKQIVIEDENEALEEIDHDIEEVKEDSIEKEIEEKWIYIDICGEIKKPGVIKVLEGARVIDAVELAGGLLETADRRQVNMARILLDGEQIYIPKIGDNMNSTDSANNLSTTRSTSSKININTASKEELETLNGIGQSLAERIIQYREANGNFKDIKDIMKVSGIGEKKFEGIREHISIN